MITKKISVLNIFNWSLPVIVIVTSQQWELIKIVIYCLYCITIGLSTIPLYRLGSTI